ncbi:hypothetical protein BD289DRAFT_420773 [Coniella lustricola]|uniref:Uncharacterized protein n=1 Tax=Coniella lustricola TaxID=2025994 RepID=A0A2T3AMT8_9PEZI|nr:hypothetical protein BD289DRAFT_420773 [Coniella lustricola]
MVGVAKPVEGVRCRMAVSSLSVACVLLLCGLVLPLAFRRWSGSLFQNKVTFLTRRAMTVIERPISVITPNTASGQLCDRGSCNQCRICVWHYQELHRVALFPRKLVRT